MIDRFPTALYTIFFYLSTISMSTVPAVKLRSCEMARWDLVLLVQSRTSTSSEEIVVSYVLLF